MRTVRKILKLNVVKGLKTSIPLNDLEKCESCSLAKSQHLTIMLSSRMIVAAPGDVLAIDPMGPFPQSLNKFSYALIIKDHFSLLVAFIPLKEKSGAAEHIMKFEQLTLRKVKCLQSGNGGEFNSKLMEDFFRREGIFHEKTFPYKHHQNGKIE
ncbi:hypothetical protein O181_079157 [Austropuccinia psidii MF-1]|uniref:Integrase catalytic domain-containing protein n=1 Tax=Austropuccinia psidii MF-1 TaxID=1389203 RepID=A0A9Q3IG91_9BASI|nr:hypothetical protein [Austropuccinia psidii MF-1]